MKRSAGFSLLEVVIAAVILSAVMAAAMQILLSFSGSVAKEGRSANLEARGRQFAQFCRGDLMTARFSGAGPTVGGTSGLGILSDYTEIRYQVPVLQSAGGTVSYGYSARVGLDDLSGLGAVCILRLEAETVFRESPSANAAAGQPAGNGGVPLPPLPTLETVVLNTDINRDGTRSDTFLRGRLRKYVVDAAGGLVSQESLSEYVMVQVNPAGSTYRYAMAAPGGAPEPLFRFVDADDRLVAGSTPGTQAVAIDVAAWHGNYEENRRDFMIRRTSERIRFRIRQQ